MFYCLLDLLIRESSECREIIELIVYPEHSLTVCHPLCWVPSLMADKLIILGWQVISFAPRLAKSRDVKLLSIMDAFEVNSGIMDRVVSLTSLPPAAKWAISVRGMCAINCS